MKTGKNNDSNNYFELAWKTHQIRWILFEALPGEALPELVVLHASSAAFQVFQNLRQNHFLLEISKNLQNEDLTNFFDSVTRCYEIFVAQVDDFYPKILPNAFKCQNIYIKAIFKLKNI
jgi:hypothetical protein